MAILLELQLSGKVTVHDLAQKLEVSERTVRRDLETIGASGIPVYAERGYGGGWTVPEGYRSKLTNLTVEEISSLVLLESSSVVSDLGLSESAQAAFRKLLAALPAAARQDAEFARRCIHIDGAGWDDSKTRDNPLLATAQQAVWEQRDLVISYRSRGADADKERTIRALGLVAKRSVWYLVADTDEGLRTFRMSRLADAYLTDRTFERPSDFDLAAYWEGSTSAFKAALPRYPSRVRVKEAAWPNFRDERYIYAGEQEDDEESGVSQMDGWVHANVEFHTLESAVTILLGYGRQAEALAPNELREAVIEEVRSIGELYRSEK